PSPDPVSRKHWAEPQVAAAGAAARRAASRRDAASSRLTPAHCRARPPCYTFRPMSTHRSLRTLAVIGAGNMGSGIAQKAAADGFPVLLIDLDDAKVARGLGIVEKTLAEAV